LLDGFSDGRTIFSDKVREVVYGGNTEGEEQGRNSKEHRLHPNYGCFCALYIGAMIAPAGHGSLVLSH
jgi:hypothetical protein